MPPELAGVEFEEEVSVAGVEAELELSGEDWPDCVDGTAGDPGVPPAAGAVGSVAEEDGEVAASPEAAGLGEDGAALDGTCGDC